MKYDPQKHNRRSYRLQGHDYAGSAAYFVTIVTTNRACLFGEIVAQEMILNSLGRIANEFFLSIPEHFSNAEVDVLQVMPNHVHGIIVLFEGDQGVVNQPSVVAGAPFDVVGAQHAAPLQRRTAFPNAQSGSLGAIIRSYKSAVSRCANLEFGFSNIWQRNYHDHIIRNETEWRKIRDYITYNPANWNEDEENPEGKPIHKS